MSSTSRCRWSVIRGRWEVETWPNKPTAYPCAHDHTHCRAIGCVTHFDGMHADARGDAIAHVGCPLCRPAYDRATPPERGDS